MITEMSFAAAYAEGFPKTRGLLLSKGIREADAEEHAQAAWARGWAARSQLREDGAILQWINSIAMNLMRRAKQHAKRYGALDESRQSAAAPAPVADRIDANSLLEKCSNLDRWLLLQRYAAGMAMQEIAERGSMTSVAIRVRLHRAKLALRRAVNPPRLSY
jgi:DNA-directed RNA polymerase specialized sigma24 family protein